MKDSSALIEKTNQSGKHDLAHFDAIVKLYIDTKGDYRNSLNMEQTIINFAVATLALGIGSGFTLFGKIQEWIIFTTILPFLLSLVKILYLHQKHRSKTYKVYSRYLENYILMYDNEYLPFEIWKETHITSFVGKRIGFFFSYICTLVIIPYLFMAIGYVSFKVTDHLYLMIFAIVFVITLASDVICFNYLHAINQILD